MGNPRSGQLYCFRYRYGAHPGMIVTVYAPTGVDAEKLVRAELNSRIAKAGLTVSDHWVLKVEHVEVVES